LDKKFELGPRWQRIVNRLMCIKQVMGLVYVTGKTRKRREEKRREDMDGRVLQVQA
jgi:hypothetical protein